MRFLFRLDLSLHRSAEKKFGIWNFGTEHGLEWTIPAVRARRTAGQTSEDAGLNRARVPLPRLYGWPYLCAGAMRVPPGALGHVWLHIPSNFHKKTNVRMEY